MAIWWEGDEAILPTGSFEQPADDGQSSSWVSHHHSGRRWACRRRGMPHVIAETSVPFPQASFLLSLNIEREREEGNRSSPHHIARPCRFSISEGDHVLAAIRKPRGINNRMNPEETPYLFTYNFFFFVEPPHAHVMVCHVPINAKLPLTRERKRKKERERKRCPSCCGLAAASQYGPQDR